MPSVQSEETYRILWIVSRYLFVFLLFLLFVFALLWFLSDRKNRRERLRNLPGAGTVGELIVLSGSRNLSENTWFPVPREGVLGSVRSCDLVVPCPGVRAMHLDFSWQDGLGLLIRPRSGCEAQINGVPVTCRTDARSVPLTHGSLLQVGEAVLRLHLFAALDLSPSREPEQVGADLQAPLPEYPPDPAAPGAYPPPAAQVAAFPPVMPEDGYMPPPVPSVQSAENPPAPQDAPESSWKEDWSE